MKNAYLPFVGNVIWKAPKWEEIIKLVNTLQTSSIAMYIFPILTVDEF